MQYIVAAKSHSVIEKKSQYFIGTYRQYIIVRNTGPMDFRVADIKLFV